MINKELLNLYYEKKQLIRLLEKEVSDLRKTIIKEMEFENIFKYECEDYRVTLSYTHETTPEFLSFLKESGNENYINEKACAGSFHIMNIIYNFSEDEVEKYWRLKNNPTLVVKLK